MSTSAQAPAGGLQACDYSLTCSGYEDGTLKSILQSQIETGTSHAFTFGMMSKSIQNQFYLMLLCVLVTVGFSVVACQDKNTLEKLKESESSQGLIHGKQTELYQKSVVRLSISANLDADREGDISCTGSIIGKKSILTAAHCFSKIKKGSLISIYRTIQKNNFPTEVLIGTTPYFSVHEKYNDDIMSNYDLAVVTLRSNTPPDMTPLPLVSANWQLNQATKLTFVGAGRRTPDLSQDPGYYTVEEGKFQGTKTMGYATWKQWFAAWLEVPKISAGDVIVLTPNSVTSASICSGDSGGALLDTTKSESAFLAGVLFSGHNLSIKDDSTYCLPNDVYIVPVSAHLDWIQERIKPLK